MAAVCLQARDIGSAAAIPLGISSSDVQLGEQLHETPHSIIHKVACRECIMLHADNASLCMSGQRASEFPHTDHSLDCRDATRTSM